MSGVFTKFRRETYQSTDEVWRYMDFTKFVDLIDSSCLYFPRLTVLRKIDPYEGSFMPFVSLKRKDSESRKTLRQLDKSIASTTFVSSWYLSGVESAALWRLFLKSDEGIAIKSTIDRLSESIARASLEHTVWIGSVTYGHGSVEEGKAKGPRRFSGDDAVFTKRACFEHEKELRLVIYEHDLAKPIARGQTGLKVPVDISSLISEVVVSPEAPRWMKDLVERVLKKYGHSLAVRQSTLNELRC